MNFQTSYYELRITGLSRTSEDHLKIKNEIGLLLRVAQPLTIGFVITDNFNTRWILFNSIEFHMSVMVAIKN